MRKVGIVTLNGYYNYGNRLQNYALQTVLESLDCKVETIINNTKPLPKVKVGLTGRLIRIKNKSIKEIMTRLQNEVKKIYYVEVDRESELVRTEIFKEFTRDFIHETNFKISEGNIPAKLSDEYCYFVTGSDQVWNPDYINGSSINFLTFADKSKRISYAPSFGVSSIPEDVIEKYKEWIQGIEFLSVREEEGAKLIQQITGRNAHIFVDPTLLLNKYQWLSISKIAPNKPKGKYLLTYFLGGVPEGYRKKIKEFAKKYKLEIINLGYNREIVPYRTGPREFIDYISSCSIFCTDSFHGTVFSLIFEKPFIVFEREGLPSSMFSRINTLLTKFHLENRKVEDFKWDHSAFQIDYSHVPTILNDERNKALDYLISCLNLKSGKLHKPENLSKEIKEQVWD